MASVWRPNGRQNGKNARASQNLGRKNRDFSRKNRTICYFDFLADFTYEPVGRGFESLPAYQKGRGFRPLPFWYSNPEEGARRITKSSSPVYDQRSASLTGSAPFCPCPARRRRRRADRCPRRNGRPEGWFCPRPGAWRRRRAYPPRPPCPGRSWARPE